MRANWVRANWKAIGGIVGVATIVCAVFAALSYLRPVAAPTATAAPPEQPGAVDFRGGDNNGGGVFIENSPINGAVPKVRAGNGGPNGPGGPIRIDNSPMTPPTPAR